MHPLSYATRMGAVSTIGVIHSASPNLTAHTYIRALQSSGIQTVQLSIDFASADSEIWDKLSRISGIADTCPFSALAKLTVNQIFPRIPCSLSSSQHQIRSTKIWKRQSQDGAEPILRFSRRLSPRHTSSSQAKTRPCETPSWYCGVQEFLCIMCLANMAPSTSSVLSMTYYLGCIRSLLQKPWVWQPKLALILPRYMILSSKPRVTLLLLRQEPNVCSRGIGKRKPLYPRPHRLW